MEHFAEIIKNYIEERIKTDETLKNKVESSNKTYQGCSNYIIKIVKEKQKGNIGVLSDEECYGLMVHYFIEDSIEEEKEKQNNISVAHSSTPITNKASKNTNKTNKKTNSTNSSKVEKKTESADKTEKVEEVKETEKTESKPTLADFMKNYKNKKQFQEETLSLF